MEQGFKKVNYWPKGYTVVLLIFLTTMEVFGFDNMSDSLITKEVFGIMPDGKKVNLFSLKNSSGLVVKITDYGGTVVSVQTPDRNGNSADIIIGYDSFEDLYHKNDSYFGVLVGRYANRIGNARFSLAGKEHVLSANNGDHHLHGGVKGNLDKVLWSSQIVDEKEQPRLRLTYHSSENSSEYSGNVDLQVDYSLTENNELVIEYRASSDKPTIINLTNHSYFNLLGLSDGDDPIENVLGHEVSINADFYTPVDETLIPTGEIISVKNTPMDFIAPKTIGLEIGSVSGGYDHNYVLNKTERDVLSLAAKVLEPKSGRTLTVLTTKPGLQFYTGNFLDGTQIGKYGKPIIKNGGFCMESQFFPNSPNQHHFPSPVLLPSETYTHKTVYKFGIKK